MKIIFRLFILLLLSIATKGQVVEQTFDKWIAVTKCAFYYSSTDSSPFVFQYCNVKDSLILDWKACFYHCCRQLPDTQKMPSLLVLNTCSDKYWENQKTKTLFIMISIVGGLILFFGCSCVLLYKFRTIFTSVRQIHDNTKKPLTIEWTQETDVNNAITNLKWSSKAQKDCKLQNSEEICCICFNEDTTVELFCKHQFHPYCIGTWLLKGEYCPCCRKKDITGVKIYCEKCLSNYLVCTRALLEMHASDFPLRCDSCLSDKLLQQQHKQVIISHQMQICYSYPILDKNLSSNNVNIADQLPLK